MTFNPQVDKKIEAFVDFNTPKDTKVHPRTPGKGSKFQGRTVQKRKQLPGDENITSNFNKAQKTPKLPVPATPVSTTPMGGRPRSRSNEVIEVAPTVKLHGRDTERVQSLTFLINGGDVELTDDELRANITQLETDLNSFCTKHKNDRNQTDLTYYNKYYETALLDSYKKIIVERELKKIKLDNANANLTIEKLTDERDELKNDLKIAEEALAQQKEKSGDANKSLLNQIKELNQKIKECEGKYFEALNTVKACRRQAAHDKTTIKTLKAEKTEQAEKIDILTSMVAQQKLNVQNEQAKVQAVTEENEKLADENAKLRQMLGMFHSLATSQMADLARASKQ